MTPPGALDQWFFEGRLVGPDPQVPSFVDLAGALASLSGCEGFELTQAGESLKALIGPSDHLVFVLVDGMGDGPLTRISTAGFLRRHRVERLKAVFPSTTAAALTSLATCAWPAKHSACGWWMYLPARDMSITTLPFVERFTGRPLEEQGIGVAKVLPLPSVWAGAAHQPLTLLKAGLEDGVFARYMTGERPRHGYRSMEEAALRVVRHVKEAAGQSFTYLYLPQFDAMCHEKGVASALPVLEKIDALLGRLSIELAGKARLVVSADHGMVDLSEARVVVIDDDHELLETLLVPPTGEPTMPIFHVRQGEEERFQELFGALAGDLFALVTPDEVESLGLLGPGRLSEEVRPRLGTYVGIAPEAAGLYVRRPGHELFVHRAVHCGLSPEEMWIPLILAD